ncbi:MAG: hypothetical protein ABIE94_03610 [archaeon]
MNKKAYLITGVVFIIVSVILFFVPNIWADIPNMLQGSDPWGLFLPVGIILLLILGVFYLLYGMDKLKMNKFSDISIKVSYWAFVLGLIIPFLILGVLAASGSDPMGAIIIYPFIIFGVILIILSFIYSLMAFRKKQGKKPVVQPVAAAPEKPVAPAPVKAQAAKKPAVRKAKK